MMSIKRLLVLHQRRLTQTERVLYEMRRQLATAESEEARCRDALNIYRTEALERENAINATLFGCIVKREAIYVAKEEIADLKRKEVELEEALVQASKVVTELKEQVENVRLSYLRQGTRTEKYIELSKQEDMTAEQLVQVKEEMEIEDLLMFKK